MMKKSGKKMSMANTNASKPMSGSKGSSPVKKTMPKKK